MSKLDIKLGLDNTANPENKVTLDKEDKKKRGNSRTSTDADFTKNLQPDTITAFSVLDESEEKYVASKIRRAIYLKLAIKDKTGAEFGEPKAKADGTAFGGAIGTTAGTDAPRDQWTVVLKSIEDSQKLHMDTTTARLVMGEDLKLATISDLAKIIDLNDYTTTSYENNNDAPKVMWDFSKSLQALIKLEELLEECYQKFGKRQTRYNTKGTHGEKWFLWYSPKAPDFDPNGIIEQAKKLEEYQNYMGDAHKLYFTGNTNGPDGFLKTGGGNNALKNDATKIKSVLYHLNDGRATAVGKLYQDKINFWLDYFKKLYRWAAMGGFTDNHEVLLVHRLGFQDIDARNFKDKKFMGFPILTGTDGKPLEIEPATSGDTASDAGEEGFKIKGSTDCNKIKYTSPQINYVPGGEINITDATAWKKPENYIRALRGLEVKDSGGTGAETAPFWYDVSGTSTSIFSDIKRSSRQDLFGFQPQDLGLTLTDNLDDTTAKSIAKTFGSGHDLSHGDNWKWDKDDTKYMSEHPHLTTRIKFLLMDTNDILKAMQIAFTGKVEGAPEVFHHLDPEIPATGVDANLNQAHTNKEAVLKDYYDFIKRYSVTWTDDNKYQPKNKTLDGKAGNDKTQAAVDVLDNAYKGASIWAKIWDTNYNSINDKKRCEDDQAEVEKILAEKTKLTTGGAEPLVRFLIQDSPDWKKALEAKKTEIANRIVTLSIPPKPQPGTLDALLKDDSGASEIAKKIYQKAKDGGMKGTENPSAELTKLADLIDKVKAGTAGEAELKSLRQYSTAADGSEEKKAWDLANEVKDSGIDANSTNGAGADALQKMEAALTVAKEAAKKVMESENGAAAAIGIDGQTSIPVIEKIAKIFKDAQEAYLEKDANKAANRKSTLEGHQTNSSNEWAKVNLYKKGGGTTGYADGAIEYLKGVDKKQSTTIDDLKKETTGNGVITKWEVTGGASSGVSEEDAKRTAAFVELTKNGTTEEEKELGNLLGKKNNTGEFKDDEANLDKDLAAIKELIKKLEEYKEAADTDAKGQARKKLQEKVSKITDSKALIESWISSLKERQTSLEATQASRKKDKGDDGKNQKEGSIWTSVPAIIGYCLVGAAAIGGLAWLALKGSGEEEGEE
ncbi:MAG: hypothetical protein I3273_05660 [Candidatus Moeniiplasma glomeromycotorum]|nr:hypothetical protein [Candidatus Moeniiplasma glomeromycotorum]MCE8168055.1 hypothetical protein [Candidatus Moeniiplasma glomeromycotorum]MCE8169572.1 hypothetical protein [Candidatus Moeniiplasma glomeromycotorum]